MNSLFDVLADWNQQLEHIDGLAEALAACDVEEEFDDPIAASDADLSEPAP